MTLLENIKLFEKLAQVAQEALETTMKRGGGKHIRNKLAARLARIDQLIAEHKDQAGIPGDGSCAYLEVNNG